MFLAPNNNPPRCKTNSPASRDTPARGSAADRKPAWGAAVPPPEWRSRLRLRLLLLRHMRKFERTRSSAAPREKTRQAEQRQWRDVGSSFAFPDSFLR